MLTSGEHTAPVSTVTFSPDRTRLATASANGAVKMWDAVTGQVLGTLSGHTDVVFGVAFSPEGARLAMASRDGTARVWDAASGQEMFKLSDHGGMVIGIAYSPDGTRLATASWDRTAKVWDAKGGKALLTLSGHNNRVAAVAFSPDGRHLASASADGAIRVHVLKIDDLMALARRRLSRSWTSTECQRYLHQDQCPPTVTAVRLIVEGRNRARVGDLNGAVASLQRARELDPAVVFDPEAEARALTVASLVATGKNRAQAGDVDGAAESFRKARDHNPTMALDPQAAARHRAGSALIERGGRLVKQGRAHEALALYKAAQEVDPTLKISASSWSLICWHGALRGYTADVMAACEQAVTLVPEHGMYRDSRGLARALMGDYAGAIEDFKFYVEWSQRYVSGKPSRSKRQAWVAELEAGRNPFGAATLEALRLREP